MRAALFPVIGLEPERDDGNRRNRAPGLRALIQAAAWAVVAAGALSVCEPAAAGTACDALHVFDNGRVSSIVDDPACLAKLRADLPRTADPFQKSALSSAVIIGDNRLASAAWRAGDRAAARRLWTQSVVDGRIEVMTAELRGLSHFLDKRYARAFRWFLCSADGPCSSPKAIDESLAEYGVDGYLVAGVKAAARGDYASAEAQLTRAAHQPVPRAISGNPQSFVMLGMVELSAGERGRGIDHLIEASLRTGTGAPEIAPDAFWAGVSADILRTL